MHSNILVNIHANMSVFISWQRIAFICVMNMCASGGIDRLRHFLSWYAKPGKNCLRSDIKKRGGGLPGY